jgi:hypothetical protein
VAELERRPDVSLNLDWMVMRPQQEPGLPAFGGDDSVQIGAMVNVPLWHEKYNAMRDEAVHESMARQFSLYDVQRQYEAVLAELLEQARAAARTAALYNSTMLPQARQTFEADQRAYVGPGTIEFDRVIEDFRTVLTLEEGYHRAKAEWAIAVARIEQAIAQEVGSLPEVPTPAPAGLEPTESNSTRTDIPEILQVSGGLVGRQKRMTSATAASHRNSINAGRTTTRAFRYGAAESLGRDRRTSTRDR